MPACPKRMPRSTLSSGMLRRTKSRSPASASSVMAGSPDVGAASSTRLRSVEDSVPMRSVSKGPSPPPNSGICSMIDTAIPRPTSIAQQTGRSPTRATASPIVAGELAASPRPTSPRGASRSSHSRPDAVVMGHVYRIRPSPRPAGAGTMTGNRPLRERACRPPTGSTPTSAGCPNGATPSPPTRSCGGGRSRTSRGSGPRSGSTSRSRAPTSGCWGPATCPAPSGSPARG